MQKRGALIGGLAALGLLLLLGWWSMRGQAPMQRVGDGSVGGDVERNSTPATTLEPDEQLAAADRPVEARASLDDRRAWSATLAFAPDMAWLAPQLVWRVRAAGGDSDDAMEPLAPLPPDVDGDGAIELALCAPPERAGERVVVDLHVGDGTEYWIATLHVPTDGARVDVRWTDLPLVAAGFIVPEASAHELSVECSVQVPLSQEDQTPEASEILIPILYPSRCLRGDGAQFCVLDSRTRDLFRFGRALVELALVRGTDSVSSERQVPLATTGIVLGVDRANARIALDLPPNTHCPHLGVSVVDVHDRVITYVELDRLAKSAVRGVAEIAFTAPPGRVRFAIVDHLDGVPALDEDLHTVHPIELFAGETTLYPSAGPMDVGAEPRLARVTVLPGAPPRITAWWECDADREHAFDLGGWEPGSATRDGAPTSVLMFVPPSAQRLCVSAVGARTQRLDAWRGSTRVLEFEAMPPARFTVDWSRSELADVAGDLALMLTLPSAVGPREEAFLTNLHDDTARLSLRTRCGSSEAMLVHLADELPPHAVEAIVWVTDPVSDLNAATFAMSEDGIIVTINQHVVSVLDITANGVSCLGVQPASDYLSRHSVFAHLAPGREYVVQLGDVIRAADDE